MTRTYTLLLAALACLTPARAAEPMDVEWKKLCEASRDHQLLLTTTTGEKVEGYCMTVNVNEVTLTAKGKAVRIARTALAQISMHRAKGHQLQALGRGMRTGLRTGISETFSPLAPGGLVLIPATLAWGAVAAPFCLLADLNDHLEGSRTIRLQ